MAPKKRNQKTHFSVVDLKRQMLQRGCSSADAAGLFQCSKSEVTTRTKRAVVHLLDVAVDRTITKEDVQDAIKPKRRELYIGSPICQFGTIFLIISFFFSIGWVRSALLAQFPGLVSISVSRLNEVVEEQIEIFSSEAGRGREGGFEPGEPGETAGLCEHTLRPGGP